MIKEICNATETQTSSFMDGFNCLKAIAPLRGDNLFFTTKSQGIPGTHLIDLSRMEN